MKNTVHHKMDLETEFLSTLIELHHGEPVQKKLRLLAKDIPWVEGYPANRSSFWNAESFMWEYKIDKEIRDFIKQELISILAANKGGCATENKLPQKSSRLQKKVSSRSFLCIPPNTTPKNLDLGCGAYSYIPSVGFDISPKMLHLNDNISKRIMGDLEQPLPFKNEEFDSVTAIFLLNYIVLLPNVLAEIKRVLMSEGKFIVVLSAKSINKIHQKYEKQKLTPLKWKTQLQKYFSVTFEEKKGLLFFTCVPKTG